MMHARTEIAYERLLRKVTMGTLTATTSRASGPAKRQPCAYENCFATFEDSPGRQDEIRHCNRGGPDGGHAHRFDENCWQLVAGRMEHDR